MPEPENGCRIIGTKSMTTVDEIDAAIQTKSTREITLKWTC